MSGFVQQVPSGTERTEEFGGECKRDNCSKKRDESTRLSQPLRGGKNVQWRIISFDGGYFSVHMNFSQSKF